jgi:hypothetical protein
MDTPQTWIAVPAEISTRSVGKMGHCFKNTQAWCEKDSTLKYVEGIAYDPDGLPYHHAWAVNLNNDIVECTWKYGRGETIYVGFIFSHEEQMLRSCLRGNAGHLLMRDEILRCNAPEGRFPIPFPLNTLWEDLR